MGSVRQAGLQVSTFFYRTLFPLFFAEEIFEVRYTVCHMAAAVEAVGSVADRKADGTIERWQGYLIIRDRGDPSQSSIPKVVYVVNCRRDIMELPKDCGRMVGEFQSEHGRERWAVFLRLEEAASRPSAGSPQTRSREGRARSRTSSASVAAAGGTKPQDSKDSRTDEDHAPEEPLWPL